jgi:hypothetical protein
MFASPRMVGFANRDESKGYVVSVRQSRLAGFHVRPWSTVRSDEDEEGLDLAAAPKVRCNPQQRDATPPSNSPMG